MPLWLAGEPLVLASKSAIRHALLRDAGVPLEVRPADIDERTIEQRSPTRDAGELAALLAREKLGALRGRTHELHTAIALVRESAILFEHREVARLTMRAFSDSFLEAYLDAIGAAVTASVGGYQLERIGIQLFERIEGDHFVSLGLPLVALLRYMRQAGWLAA